MNQMKLMRSAVAAVALLTVLAQPAPAASSLSQLRGVQELKSWFNGLKGRPRLILLLSPT
jgi:hypothetical protein